MRKVRVEHSFVCDEDREQMAEVEGGRACERCQHVVRDLTAMRQADALALLKEAEARGERVCVWQLRGPDGETLFLDSPPERLQLARQRHGLSLLLRAASMVALLAAEAPEVEPEPEMTVINMIGLRTICIDYYIEEELGASAGYANSAAVMDCTTWTPLTEAQKSMVDANIRRYALYSRLDDIIRVAAWRARDASADDEEE